MNVGVMSSDEVERDGERGAEDSIAPPSKTSQDKAPDAAVPGAAPGKTLSPEAVRALQEAEARRQAAAANSAGQDLPTEIGGRDGAEPTRYGDWEKKGIAVDF